MMYASPNTTEWKDTKRYLWLIGLVPPTMLFFVAPIAWCLAHFGYRSLAESCAWIGPIWVYLLVPVLDHHYGVNRDNPPDDAIDQLENDKYYRYCTYAYIPFQYVSILIGAYLFTARDLSPIGVSGSISWWSKIGLAISIGVLGGLGINVGHELGHKRDSFERWLARIALAQTGYGHFYIEHNRGHHVRVATPEDPASSRLGENYWVFLPRSIFGGIRSSWNLEKQRLQRCHQRTWSLHNDIINSWIWTVGLWAILIGLFRAPVIPFLLIQAIYGILLVESANYIEHYGLLRRKQPNGRYESCSPYHSWNSDYMVSNAFLFSLQRHSDHHANPVRRYQTLRTMQDVPQLPYGYPTLIIVSYFPWWWRKLMDGRVLALYQGDLTQVNLCPRAYRRYHNGDSPPAISKNP